MNRYLVISSDCHAGLPNEQYREWLDPAYRQAFDDSQAERALFEEELKGRGMRNEEFAEEWERENEEGLRGGWDAARRDKELDADGVAGEVIFPDADAVTSGASAPFGAGLGAGGDHDPELLMAGARAHNRWLAELCAESPDARRASRSCRSCTTSTPRWPRSPERRSRACAAGSSSRRCGSRTRRTTTTATTRCGPRARTSGCRSTCTRARPTRSPTASTSASTCPRCAGGRCARCGSCCGRASSSSSRLKFVVTECGAFWASDLLWTCDIVYDREHAAKKLGSELGKRLTMRPSEYFDRNCSIGASNTRRRELARRYEIGVENLMWGNDFPHPEGTWPHTKEWLRNAFWDIPVDETAAILGGSAAEVYGFDTDALAPLAERIGPTPDELGQTGADADGRLDKWTEVKAAGRPWITGREAVEVPTGD